MSFPSHFPEAASARPAVRDASAGAGARADDLLYFFSRDGGITVDVTFGVPPEPGVPAADVFAVDFAGEPAGRRKWPDT